MTMKKLIIIVFGVILPIFIHAQTKPQTLVFVGFAGRSEVEGIYQYGAGVKIPLKYGFALQPEIFYDKHYTEFYTIINTWSSVKVAAPFLEFPVQVQWGKDFGGIRPYLFVSPFVGFGLGSVKGTFSITENKVDRIEYEATSFKDSGIKPFILGGGVGIGIEAAKHFQLSVQYNSSAYDFIDYDVRNEVVRQFWSDFKETKGRGRKFFEDFYFQVALLF